MNAEYIDLLVTTHYIFLDVIAVNQPRYGLVTKALAGAMLNHIEIIMDFHQPLASKKSVAS